MLVSCPNCGADHEVDSDSDELICGSCGLDSFIEDCDNEDEGEG